MAELQERFICGICKSTDLVTYISLGQIPLPNLYLKKIDKKNPETYYPLSVCFCQKCSLSQLKYTVTPKIMFDQYPYVTSSSQTMLSHFSSLVKELSQNQGLNQDSLTVDIGSNDGSLLEQLQTKTKVLGIDPAKNLALPVQTKGIETIVDYFNFDLAKKVKSKYGPANIITSFNVFAHVPDLHSFVKGIETLLSKNGVFVAEFPYVVDLIKNIEFDTIYHEHVYYFSLKPLDILFKNHGLTIVDVRKIKVHGGSIRIYVKHSSAKNKQPINVKESIFMENKMGFSNIETYLNFSQSAYVKRQELMEILVNLKSKNKKIVGYGAAAKGNILLNFANIGNEIIEYIVDSTNQKQGKFTPGTHIKIHQENKLLKDLPDYALILAWNFKDEIIKKNKDYLKHGGKFIITSPKIKVLT